MGSVDALGAIGLYRRLAGLWGDLSQIAVCWFVGRLGTIPPECNDLHRSPNKNVDSGSMLVRLELDREATDSWMAAN